VNESQIFAAALKFATAAERAGYLDDACAGNARLRADVEALLQAQSGDPDFLEQSVANLGLTTELLAPPGSPVEPPHESEQPGLVVGGRYKLIEPIGEGGMGTVWMAQQTEPIKRLVAVKLIKAGMGSKQVLARFEAERQALALMEHPNIARVFDAGAAPDGRPFFVMELVKGKPITAYCDANRLTPRQRLELFLPVCQAIQHAHQKGVIHRDIKPNNVLVALYDDRPVPKVIDFGVAKATGQQLTEQTLHTGFGAVVGTPEYMSPEQASFNQLDVDTRSDVYSLGVLLYELLAGSPPFSQKDLARAGMLEILRVIREQEPSKPSTKLSTADGLPSLAANRGTEPGRLTRMVRGDLDWIVMKALEKDRTRRYETANGFAADVQRYLADEPVLASPPSAAYRLRKLVRRNRGSAVAGTLVLLALAVGVIGTVWQAVVATGERNAKQTALDDLGKEQQNTAEALNKSRLLAADLAFDKGQTLGEGGDTDLALLWMARSLALAPGSSPERQTAARLGLGAWRRHVNTVRLALPHDKAVHTVRFAPDGTFVTVSDEGPKEATTVNRWNPRTGQLTRSLNVDNMGALSTPMVRLSHDSNYAVLSVVANDEETTQVKDLTTGKTLWETSKSSHRTATTAAFSHDQKFVVVGYTVGGRQSPVATGEAQVFDVITGKPRGPVLKLNRPVCTSVFRHDGKGFVLGCGLVGNGTESAEARFWDLEGRETREPLEYPCMAIQMDISADAGWLATGHWDRKLRVWNLNILQEPRVIQLEGTVNGVAFSRDGRNLLTGTGEGIVRYRDLEGKPIGQPMRHNGPAGWVHFSPDGKAALVGPFSQNGARLWDLVAVGEAGVTESTPFPLAYSPDRRTVLALEGDRTAQLRDAATGQPIGRPLPHTKPVFLPGAASLPGLRQACSSDRTRAVTLDGDNVSRLWNTETGIVVAELRPFPGNATDQPLFYGAAFSPDSKLVVIGSFNGMAHVWEASTGRHLRDFKHEPKGPVYNFSFTPDGKTVLSGGTDSTGRFWDPETALERGAPLRQVPGYFCVAVSPDGRTAVTGARGEVLLWDVAARKRLFQLSGHQRGINDLSYNPDGRLVATASLDGTARLWDVASGKPVGPPLRHTGSVARVAFGLDGRTLITGTDDRVARSWPLPVAMNGTPEQLELWAQVATGLELEADGGVRILDTEEWQKRRQQLTAESKANSKP
jgi:eukaryotic-like serine/threonine-protein kinase